MKYLHPLVFHIRRRHLCCLWRGQDIGSVVLVFAALKWFDDRGYDEEYDIDSLNSKHPKYSFEGDFCQIFHSVTKQTGIWLKLLGHSLSDVVVLGTPFIKLHWFVPWHCYISVNFSFILWNNLPSRLPGKKQKPHYEKGTYFFQWNWINAILSCSHTIFQFI